MSSTTPSMSRNLAQTAETGVDGGAHGHHIETCAVRPVPSAGVQMQPLRFLQHCALCNRALGPELDIYIYKGESAFCSDECREKGMRVDQGRRNRRI